MPPIPWASRAFALIRGARDDLFASVRRNPLALTADACDLVMFLFRVSPLDRASAVPPISAVVGVFALMGTHRNGNFTRSEDVRAVVATIVLRVISLACVCAAIAAWRTLRCAHC